LVDKEMAWLVTVPLLITVTLSWLLAAVISTVPAEFPGATPVTLALEVRLAATALAPEVRSMGVSAVAAAPLREICSPSAMPVVVALPVMVAAL
jgi:hypothetical protein